jgi:mercuric ion transport protein
LLVLAGLGATVASMLSALPWLVTLSRHKAWTFSISGLLIAASFVNMYWLMPRLNLACRADDPSACVEASRISKVLLWTAAAVYAAGVFTAYALGPLLNRIDGGWTNAFSQEIWYLAERGIRITALVLKTRNLLNFRNAQPLKKRQENGFHTRNTHVNIKAQFAQADR